ncbi:MAG: DUF6573 family protein [Planctomycetota bacterium]
MSDNTNTRRGQTACDERVTLPEAVMMALQRICRRLSQHLALNEPEWEQQQHDLNLLGAWIEHSAAAKPISDELLEEHPFGACPLCENEDGFFNRHREHWFICRRHHVRWLAGENLFGSWRHETQSDWLANWAEFGSYREVDSIPNVALNEQPMLSSYSRAEALRDGVLVDVTRHAEKTGFRYTVALTASVYQSHVQARDGVGAQSEPLRLEHLLERLLHQLRTVPGPASAVTFEVESLGSTWGAETKKITLQAVCGPGDRAEPVVTIMHLDED